MLYNKSVAVANGATGTLTFGPFPPGTIVNGFVVAQVVATPSVVPMSAGSAPSPPPSSPTAAAFAIFCSDLWMQAVTQFGASVTSYQSSIPIGQALGDGTPYVAVLFDNTGGAGSVTMAVGVSVTRPPQQSLAA